MGAVHSKLALYAAVSVASFVVGTVVVSKAAPTPAPVPSASATATASASASAAPSVSPKATPIGVPAPSASGAAMTPGLYVQTVNGKIPVANGTAGQNFSAGQFGFTPTGTPPPVIVPANPGMQFVPPPAFSSTAPGTTAPPKAGAVDCIVR